MLPNEFGGPAILEEDRRYLEMRVAWLDTGMAWPGIPRRTPVTLIGNLEATPLENGEVETKTAFSGVPLTGGDGSSAPLPLPRGSAAEGDRGVEGGQAQRSRSTPTSCSTRTSASSSGVKIQLA
jgi:hypothetical protein